MQTHLLSSGTSSKSRENGILNAVCIILHYHIIFTKGQVCFIHRVPKLATPLQISWCKIVNTGQIFTKCETFMETIILN